MKGMHFQAKRADIVKNAEGNDAPKEVLDSLGHLSGHEYSNVAEVMGATNE